ncbi:ATP-dependent DNA ligase [Orlajensenia leifsoniae]|uniref:ATP-dependent DNA ligase n=1 Tax=Orlajensenia leifsoniae TaxID=2561933 RepID=A0A4Y9R645_9MICO|nr:ATP-dependent DNA ligase [Leifsonia flava]TFV99810.1 ATP-dependent DNA ligase [Leifsonia flava]
MSSMFYGEAGTEIVVADELVVHLRATITEKMRRGERFLLSWHEPAVVGDGTSSVWLDPSIPVRYHVDSGVDDSIDRGWVEAMIVAASSDDGLLIGSVPRPARD